MWANIIVDLSWKCGQCIVDIVDIVDIADIRRCKVHGIITAYGSRATYLLLLCRYLLTYQRIHTHLSFSSGSRLSPIVCYRIGSYIFLRKEVGGPLSISFGTAPARISAVAAAGSHRCISLPPSIRPPEIIPDCETHILAISSNSRDGENVICPRRLPSMSLAPFLCCSLANLSQSF
ncbi:uncharacterized protein LY79DRAFT_244952 [Colletotrichum navitas]|uniref:Uncharacterized protein n=1 Tax=Colletotrichum navitas TaxID=681940 RepID=A0AAD8PWK2_9PEZI|nr:uncharacterized protein LY79DRAFT_244952 [Colletotrichum navitas]KAK1586037.1 hypothetical protein LY79DRAFT_244952 [Colletotrichum navitas]